MAFSHKSIYHKEDASIELDNLTDTHATIKGQKCKIWTEEKSDTGGVADSRYIKYKKRQYYLTNEDYIKFGLFVPYSYPNNFKLKDMSNEMYKKWHIYYYSTEPTKYYK